MLAAIADLMDVHLGLPDPASARAELAALGTWRGRRKPPAGAGVRAGRAAPSRGPGTAVLATWRLLLDAGRLQDGEPYLAGTARTAVARMSAATAAEIGRGRGRSPSTDRGSHPAAGDRMPDRVVWLPANSPGGRRDRRVSAPSNPRRAGSTMRVQLGAGHGARSREEAGLLEGTPPHVLAAPAVNPTLGDFGQSSGGWCSARRWSSSCSCC